MKLTIDSLRPGVSKKSPLENIVPFDWTSESIHHPELEPTLSRISAHARKLERDIGTACVRHSFLLSSVETHLNELTRYSNEIISQFNHIPASDPSVARDFFIGLESYPVFTSINAVIVSADNAVWDIITLIGRACANADWPASPKWVEGKGDEAIKKYAGNDIHLHIEKAREWTAKLREYRNAIFHINAQLTQNGLEHISKDSSAYYNGIRCLLPLNPSTAYRESRPEWGIDALEYCKEIKEKVFEHSKQITILLEKQISL